MSLEEIRVPDEAGSGCSGGPCTRRQMGGLWRDLTYVYDCVALVWTATGDALSPMIIKVSLEPQGLDGNIHYLGGHCLQVDIMG